VQCDRAIANMAKRESEIHHDQTCNTRFLQQ
jgi:hypothetical protein